jgi:hypothetical protein
VESGDLQKQVASEIMGLLMLEVRWKIEPTYLFPGSYNLLWEGTLKYKLAIFSVYG